MQFSRGKVLDILVYCCLPARDLIERSPIATIARPMTLSVESSTLVQL